MVRRSWIRIKMPLCCPTSEGGDARRFELRTKERYSQVNLGNSSRGRSAIDVMRRRKDLLDVFSLLPSFLVLLALPGRPVCLSVRLLF